MTLIVFPGSRQIQRGPSFSTSPSRLRFHPSQASIVRRWNFKWKFSHCWPWATLPLGFTFAFIPSVLVNWPKGCTHLISYSLNQSLSGNVKLRPRPLGLWSSHHGAAHPQLRHPSCHPQQPGGDPSDRCSCCWIFFHQGDYCHHTGWELKQNFLAF